MTDDLHKRWSYHINYGPDGEEDWANLITPDGKVVANVRTHYAMAIVEGLSGAADAILKLQGEVAEAEEREQKLQSALMFWMPSVTEATDTGLERSAGDDAHLLAGYAGEFPKTCWGDDLRTRLEAAEAEVARMREALEGACFQILDSYRTWVADDSEAHPTPGQIPRYDAALAALQPGERT